MLPPRRTNLDMLPTRRIVSVMIRRLILVTVMASAAVAQHRRQQAPDPPVAPTAPTSTPASNANTGSNIKPDWGATSSHRDSYTLELGGSTLWRDTFIDLRAGEQLQISAEGTVTYANAKASEFGPEGIPRNLADLVHPYAIANAGHGELIGRLGSGNAARTFEVGTSVAYAAPVAGRLFLGLNQSKEDAAIAGGSFLVTVDVLGEGLSTPEATIVGGPKERSMPAITTALLDSIPRRVADRDHTPGDIVNILIVGTEKEMVNAFTSAQWVEVDISLETAVLVGLIDTIEKKDYLTMPMSTLYLFDRPQDYGFVHAEPVQVVMSRNHLRVWRSPYKVNGRTLWCVAATHDIGFERDERNNRLTHKIDPAIDNEREYVNETLSGTGLVTGRTHVLPTHPVTEAKTATGGSFHSDGRILVLVLKSGT
jgi:LssY C-terminus